MKRASLIGIVVLILLSSAAAQKSKPEWQSLEDGVQVFKMWESVGPDQPQVAILQLTNEKYEEFKKDPKAFVDGHNIFPEKVRPEARLVQMLRAPKGYTGKWAVTCFHRVSHLRCASIPFETEEPQDQEEKP